MADTKPLAEHDVEFAQSAQTGEWRWDCADCQWTGLGLWSRESCEREHEHIFNDVPVGSRRRV